MSQPKIGDYINGLISKLDIKKERVIEIKEDKNIKGDTKQINESNGIIEVRYGNEIYKTWTVKLISPLITKFLKGVYPESLMVRGLTDIVLFDKKSNEIVPIEIQKTPINPHNQFSHSEFEQKIRKQLEDNIETYDKCWFFFDSEYLRFLQSGNVGKKTSVNLTWLVKLIRENTLKVFVIKYDGIVKELTTTDFDFLKDVSQTCPLSYESDERILERNRLKIKKNVLFGYEFTQEEISKFESNFDNRYNKKVTSSYSYYIKNDDKRCKLYGYISESVSESPSINDILSCTIENKRKRTSSAVVLGIFHQNEFFGYNDNARIQFVDKFNIAQYFPGYLRNKEIWDYCKKEQRVFTMNEFRGIIEGRKHCLKLIKNQSKSLSDYI